MSPLSHPICAASVGITQELWGYMAMRGLCMPSEQPLALFIGSTANRSREALQAILEGLTACKIK